MKRKYIILSIIIIFALIGITTRSFGKYIEEKEMKLGEINIEKLYTVTVNCINPKDNSIIDSFKIENLKSGQSYSTNQPNISDYYLESTSGNTSGVVGNEDIEVTYYYKPYGVFAKYYDTDIDGKGDTLLLNPTPYFTYEGNLINEFYNQDNNEYQPNNEDHKPMWEEVLSNIKKVKVLKVIKPIFYTSRWFIGGNNINEINNIDKINTSNVENMQSMFSGCSSLNIIDVTSLDTSNVINMQDMFYDCKNLTNIDVSQFDTRKVTTMWAMFGNCHNLQSIDLSNFLTNNVTSMGMMFTGCNNLKNIDLSTFNTKSLTNMASMFCWCNNLENINLSSFNTLNVTNMADLFSMCSKLVNIDISNFNTSKVEDMHGMFYTCDNLKTILIGEKWNTNNVSQSDIMFSNDWNLKGEKGTGYNWYKTDKEYARVDEGESNPGYLTLKNYSKLMTINQNETNIKQLDKSNENQSETNTIIENNEINELNETANTVNNEKEKKDKILEGNSTEKGNKIQDNVIN